MLNKRVEIANYYMWSLEEDMTMQYIMYSLLLFMNIYLCEWLCSLVYAQ